MQKPDTLNVNMPCHWVPLLEETARVNGVTMSWVCRIILRNPKKFAVHSCKRPKKLKGDHQKFQLCFYDDKVHWKLLMLATQSEFGPYLRRLISLYLPYLYELDYETVKFNKIVRKVEADNSNGSTYVKPIKYNRYGLDEYYAKNWDGNIRIMELGISNRGRIRNRR